MSTDFSQYEGEGYIDPKDLRDLLDEATSDREALVSDAEDAEHPMEKSDMWREVAEWDRENKDAVKRLEDIVDEIGTEDTLIRGDNIDEYLRNMLEDCGDIPRDLPSYVVVDWGATCDNLKQDYSSFEYADTTYWQRST